LIKISRDMAKTLKVANFLFYGDGKDQLSRLNIRKYCANYYRSIDFVKLTVGNQYLKMSSKLNFVTYLKKI
jgi:hypothetical protein